MIKAALMMVVYALVLVMGGVVAYMLAPEGANAATALIVPSACAALMIACAVMTLMLKKNKRVGMIGIHVGLILPLVFTAAFIQRAVAGYGSIGAYKEANAAYVEAVANDATLAEEENREAFFKEKDAPDHSKAYLVATLALLSGSSVMGFFALISMRPKPSDRT